MNDAAVTAIAPCQAPPAQIAEVSMPDVDVREDRLASLAEARDWRRQMIRVAA
jgi:hypothetical protein